MKALTDAYTLNNGVKIPCVGFGTWQTPDGDTAVEAVKAALAAGYRHIDTAAIYGNEESVGRAIKESGVPREEIFLTTKVWNDISGYDETLAAFQISMEKLGVDYLDLYLIHWPNPKPFRDSWQKRNAENWRAMEKLYQDGLVRTIGISNFFPKHIEPLLQTAKVLPMVNQIKLCPGITQQEIVSYCKKDNILLEAYSPLGTGKLFEVPEVQALAEKYQKTVAQICLRWSLQMGFLPLPKSVTPSRIAENTQIFDFELAETDLDFLSNLQGTGDAPDPDTKNY